MKTDFPPTINPWFCGCLSSTKMTKHDQTLIHCRWNLASDQHFAYLSLGNVFHPLRWQAEHLIHLLAVDENRPRFTHLYGYLSSTKVTNRTVNLFAVDENRAPLTIASHETDTECIKMHWTLLAALVSFFLSFYPDATPASDRERHRTLALVAGVWSSRLCMLLNCRECSLFCTRRVPLQEECCFQ
jgi:hypothetical protein